MALNWDAINDAVEEANKFSTGGSDTDVIRVYKLEKNEPKDFRVLPPKSNIDPMYFLKYTLFMINNTPYVSLEVYGESCPLLEEYNIVKAAAKSDAGLKALLGKWDGFKLNQNFLLGVLATHEDDTSIEVLDNKVKILEMNKHVFMAIHKIMTNPKVKRACGDKSIMSRDKGIGITITKKVEIVRDKKKTTYQVLQDAAPIDFSDASFDTFYSEQGLPDLWEYLKRFKKSAEYLRSVIRNYFYGEELLEDDSKDIVEQPKKAKAAKPKVKSKTTATATAKPKVKSKTTKVAKKAAVPKDQAEDGEESNLLDQIGDL